MPIVHDRTEYTEDEGLSLNICRSGASALCQTGNNDGKSWNSPSYLYQREIKPGEPVSLERSDFEEQQENSGKQDEEEDGILEYDSPSDDDEIPSLEQVADSSPRKRFPLWKKCLLQKKNCVQLVFLYLPCYGTMELPSPFVFYVLVKIAIFFFACTNTFVLDRSLMKGSRYLD